MHVGPLNFLNLPPVLPLHKLRLLYFRVRETKKEEKGGKRKMENGSEVRSRRVFDLDKYIFRYTDDTTGIEFR